MSSQVFNPLSGNFDTVYDQADEIKYDNTTSGLTAVEVQAAIDEIEAQILALPDPLIYVGTWDASTNTPTLDNADTGVDGFLYQVNAAGTVDFGAGNITFAIGDKVVNNGTVWEKWDMTDAVLSVNGQSGVVSLDSDDIAEGVVNLYFTDERAQDAAGALATSSSKVSLTYNDISNTLTPDIVALSLVNGDIAVGAAIDAAKIADGSVSSTEFQYLGGVTSDIQTQLGGKVTAVSVASANGFAGSSSGGTTPALTLSTTVTGILNGNGTSVAAAVAGDFPTLNQNTTGTAANVSGTVAIANGGTGQTSQTAGFDALSPTTTKGDIIVDDGTNAVRLPVGITTGFTLQVDPSAATGVKWAAPTSSAPSEIRLNTGNGFGSTSTVIRRFTNVVQNIGSDIVYTDSAANGASFTINTNGIYAITYTEEGNTGSPLFGISLNSASLTTDINAIAIGEILTISNCGAGNGRECVAWTGLLSATDVVRMHTNNGSATFADNVQVFTIVGPF